MELRNSIRCSSAGSKGTAVQTLGLAPGTGIAAIAFTSEGGHGPSHSLAAIVPVCVVRYTSHVIPFVMSAVIWNQCENPPARK